MWGVLQFTTPTPGVGPAELVDVWPSIVRFGWFLAGFVVVALVGLYILQPMVDRVVRQRNRNNPTLQEAISRYLTAGILGTAVLVGGLIAGYGGFLGGSAIVIAAVTLAIGVAGQAVLGSLVSGLALVLDPEFTVGSYIEWDDGKGTVQSITLRVTRILSPDGQLLTVPNTVLTSQAIRRPFGRGRYRVTERFRVGYDTDLDAALGQLQGAAEEAEDIRDVPGPSVYVETLNQDGVELTVYYWIDDPTGTDVAGVQSRYRRAVKRRLEDANVTISPPAERNLSGHVSIDGDG